MLCVNEEACAIDIDIMSELISKDHPIWGLLQDPLDLKRLRKMLKPPFFGKSEELAAKKMAVRGILIWFL